MKKGYFIIPGLVFVTALLGSIITNKGMDWYRRINLPLWIPSGSTIGLIWTGIFTLVIISAILIYRSSHKATSVWALFTFNALLNVGWSFLFFGLHLLGIAIIEAILLDFSIILLVIVAWPISKKAALLLFPYAGWVTFASYLTYVVWSLNR